MKNQYSALSQAFIVSLFLLLSTNISAQSLELHPHNGSAKAGTLAPAQKSTNNATVGEIRMRQNGEAIFTNDPLFYCTMILDNCAEYHLESIAIQFPLAQNDTSNLVFNDPEIGCIPVSNNTVIYALDNPAYTEVPQSMSSHLTVQPSDTFRVRYSTSTASPSYVSVFADWDGNGIFELQDNLLNAESDTVDYTLTRSLDIIVPDTVCNGVRRVRFVVRDVPDSYFSCDLAPGAEGQTIDIDFEVTGGQDCLPLICPFDVVELEPIGSDLGLGVDFIWLIDDTIEINMGAFPNNPEFNGILDSLFTFPGVTYPGVGIHTLSAIAVDTLTDSICDYSSNELLFELTDSVCNATLICDISSFEIKPYGIPLYPDSILPVYSFCPFDHFSAVSGYSSPSSIETVFGMMEYTFINQSDSSEQYLVEFSSPPGSFLSFVEDFKSLFGVSDPLNEPYPTPGIYKVTGNVYSELLDVYCQSPTEYLIEILAPSNEGCTGCQSGDFLITLLSDSIFCPGESICIEITGYSANGEDWFFGENYALGLTSIEDGSVHFIDFNESFYSGYHVYTHTSWYQGCLDIWELIENSGQEAPPPGQYQISGQVYLGDSLCAETMTSQVITLLDSTWTACGGTVGINDSQQLIDWVVYPNPAQDYVRLDFDAQGNDWTVRLVDQMGKVLLSEKNKTIDLSAVSSGLYVLELELSGLLSRKKLLVE